MRRPPLAASLTRAALLTILLAGGALTACSGSSGGTAPPSPSPTVTPTPSPTPTVAPAAALAALARAGMRAQYSADYVLRAGTRTALGTERVRRSRAALRVDVVIHGKKPTTLIIRKGNDVACVGRGASAKCVSAPTTILRSLNPSTPFSRYLFALNHPSRQYDVVAAGSVPAADRLPAAACFRVRPAPRARGAVVSAGAYCFSAHGILVRASFGARRLALRSLTEKPPARTVFRPPAPVQT